MRKRTIKPEFFTDPKTGRLSPTTQILFVGMWCLADREGYIENDADFIKMQILPYQKVGIESCLQELLEQKLIIECEHNGKKLLNIVNFLRHQPIHPHEAKSLYPSIGSDDVIICNYKILLPNSNSKGNSSSNNNNEILFDKFYSEYPRKQSKKKAKEKFLLLMKQSSDPANLSNEIMKGLVRYKASLVADKTERQYIKHPNTWLYNECWNDEFTVAKAGKIYKF